MQITERRRGDVILLAPKGKITLDEYELLRERVQELTDRKCKKIVLDCRDVPYIDQAGLAGLVQSYTTLVRSGGKLKLLSLTRRIRNLLSITMLLVVFECFDDEDSAVASFG